MSIKIRSSVTNSKTVLLLRKAKISNSKSKMTSQILRVNSKTTRKLRPIKMVCYQTNKRMMDRLLVKLLKGLCHLLFSTVRMQEESSRRKIHLCTLSKSWNWSRKIGVLCLSPRKISIRSKVGSIELNTMRGRKILTSRRARTQIQAGWMSLKASKWGVFKENIVNSKKKRRQGFNNLWMSRLKKSNRKRDKRGKSKSIRSVSVWGIRSWGKKKRSACYSSRKASRDKVQKSKRLLKFLAKIKTRFRLKVKILSWKDQGVDLERINRFKLSRIIKDLVTTSKA